VRRRLEARRGGGGAVASRANGAAPECFPATHDRTVEEVVNLAIIPAELGESGGDGLLRWRTAYPRRLRKGHGRRNKGHSARRVPDAEVANLLRLSSRGQTRAPNPRKATRGLGVARAARTAAIGVPGAKIERPFHRGPELRIEDDH